MKRISPCEFDLSMIQQAQKKKKFCIQDISLAVFDKTEIIDTDSLVLSPIAESVNCINNSLFFMKSYLQNVTNVLSEQEIDEFNECFILSHVKLNEMCNYISDILKERSIDRIDFSFDDISNFLNYMKGILVKNCSCIVSRRFPLTPDKQQELETQFLLTQSKMKNIFSYLSKL